MLTEIITRSHCSIFYSTSTFFWGVIYVTMVWNWRQYEINVRSWCNASKHSFPMVEIHIYGISVQYIVCTVSKNDTDFTGGLHRPACRLSISRPQLCASPSTPPSCSGVSFDSPSSSQTPTSAVSEAVRELRTKSDWDNSDAEKTRDHRAGGRKLSQTSDVI